MADNHALPRVFLRSLMLVALEEGDTHGYDLTERMWAMGLATADLAGVYRTLRALEQERLVESWWEPSESGPQRRVYRLNDAGLTEAEYQIEWLGGVREMLGRVVGVTHSGPGRLGSSR